jgi:hypothetical protein
MVENWRASGGVNGRPLLRAFARARFRWRFPRYGKWSCLRGWANSYTTISASNVGCSRPLSRDSF